MENAQRDKLICLWARKLLQKLNEVLPARPAEADFRRAIEPLLDQFCQEAGVSPLVHAEYTLATGRADAIFNRLVIEYERPGVLKKSLDTATAKAIKQVKDYVEALSKKQRQQLHRIAGVVFDGHYLIFRRWVNEKWSDEPPLDVNEHSLEQFLAWLVGLSSGIALTSENLNRDFAIEQLRTQNTLLALSRALSEALSKPQGMVPKLFEQWRLFFRESIDYSEAFGGRKLEPLRKWVRKAGIEVRTAEEAERFFFALHTYFALLVKFLAWLALSRHLGVKLGAPSFAELVTADSETLRHRLREMESGGIFRAYGILNLLEGDFFEWYLHAWNEKIETALREIIRRLDEYDPTTLTLVPEETRDLFKKLYHYLLPREIRHNLGEYYTPDWLAQRLLTQVDNEFFTGDPRRAEGALRKKLHGMRFLDPACGSGTFLVLIIARMLKLSTELMISETELLNTILHNVVGFDLNPLAVLTARVNYLLAISDLLEYRRGDITIPVYLADSVRTPAEGEDLFARGAYEFPTAIGKFLVPAPLCTRGRFDRFCDLLEESVRSAVATDSFERRVKTELHLSSPDWNEQAASKLCELYEHLLDLHRRGMNGLWARLLKNNFAPLTVGQFDYIVGNPPWVNWEHLPDDYRQSIAPLWLSYQLFPHKGFDAILGKSKDDISVLMAYVVMDKLLKDSGRLGFVITQSVFKTAGGGQGFRRFRIPPPRPTPKLGEGKGGGTPLRVVSVDDMVNLQPFEGASNRTAVMVLEKGKPTKYPVPYTVWRKMKGARFTYESKLDEVTAATKRLQFYAEPVNADDPTSPWLTARPKALRAVRNILGKSNYQAHAGAYTGGANAVYWVEPVLKRPDGLVVVRNITEGAKVRVDEVTEAIEPDLLYPLLRGRDVQRWKAEPSALILVTHEAGMRLKAIPEKNIQNRYPRTYGYLKRFERVLRERAAFKRYFTRPERGGRVAETGPFYSMFDVGDYTFAPWKVVWRYIASEMTAAVAHEADGKIIIPDHRLMIVPFQRKEEAYYVAGTLNSSVSRFIVASFIIGTQISTHVLEKVNVPSFDPSNRIHRRLVELSEAAHQAAVGAQRAAPWNEIEAEIDRQAAQLWGLTEAELAEIQKSLQELG